MQAISYSGASAGVREDLVRAHRRAWDRIAGPGTWFTGAERVAIAAEARAALACPLCRQRKEALTPYGNAGEHQASDALPAALVDAVHRIRTDPSRLKRSWFEGVLAAGVSRNQYVEALGVLVAVVAVDTFCRGIGVAKPSLPEPRAGEPSRYEPEGLAHDRAWVPVLQPDAVGPAEADLYPGGMAKNSRKAMSMVPDEVRGFFDLLETHYYAPDQQWDFANEYRAISHAQTELIASRVSVLNGCAY